MNTYRWKYSRYPEVIGGEVTHRYGDGAVVLAHKVLGAISDGGTR